MGIVEQILTLFGFTTHQMFIAAVCSVVLLGNFFGGLMRNIALAFGGAIKPRPITQTIGFRAALVSEVAIIIFALYYHAVLLGNVTAIQVIYWVFTLLSAPVLAYIGAQITYLIFQKRIEDRVKAYIAWERKMKIQKMAAIEAAKKNAGKPQAPKRPTRGFTPGGGR